MKKCDVCKRWGTLARLPNGVLICSQCIAELVADGFPLSGQFRCAVCESAMEFHNAKSGGLDIRICPECHKKHFPHKERKP